MFDPVRVARDFPIFSRGDLTYLDSAATSQKPSSVIRAVEDYYSCCNSNVHRGIYRISEEATELYEKSRENISHFIGSTDPTGTVFVRNTTEAINLLSYTLGRKLAPGDEILLSVMEHHSNMVPWQLLRERGVVIRYADIDSDGKLDLEDLKSKISRKTRIVSLTHASNVLGTINPVSEISRTAHEASALFILDAAQSVPHMPVDVRSIDCDFMAFSGHKMLGPAGIGVLYGKQDLLSDLPPFMGGGDMIREVRLDGATWNTLPYRFEAGTPNIEGAIGLSAAVDYLRNLGMEDVRYHEKDLMSYVMKRAEEIQDLIYYGPRDPEIHGGVFSFNLGDIPAFDLEIELKGVRRPESSHELHPHDISSFLDQSGIAVRAGHHCAMPLMTRLGVQATSRASFYIYNSRKDADKLFIALENAKKAFAR